MLAHLARIRANLLTTNDTVCLQRLRLYTEAWNRYETDPVPLRRAKCFAYVLRHMTLDVRSNPFFAGNTSSRPRAWMLLELHFGGESQVVVERPSLAHFLEGKIPRDLGAYWAGKEFAPGGCDGHLAVDHEWVVREGLEGVAATVKRHLHEGDEERQVYRQAMVVALQGVIDWAGRYAAAAAAAAAVEPDPVLRAAHERVAAACRRVPAKPAGTVFEALQSIVLCHLASVIEGHTVSVSVGLPDRALAHLVGPDFDPGETTASVVAFMLKLTANSVHASATKTQALTVGGADRHRRDQSNPLTRCFLEAANIARVGDPPLFLRWHDGLAPEIKQRALELLAAGVSMPLLVHDDPTVQGFIGAGVAPEDAWRYCVIGCNELGIPGLAHATALSSHGLVQYLALLNDTLLKHPDPDALAAPTDLLAALEQTMRKRLRESYLRGEKHKDWVAAHRPTPFTSALMRGCAESGRDLSVGMKYQYPCLYERGLTNAANALAACEQLVYRQKRTTLSELVDALRADLPDEILRRRLLAAPKWGNDDPEADKWAVELVTMRDRVVAELDRETGHRAHFVCHVVRSLHHIDGRSIAASADGRHAGMPVCDSIGAQTGTLGKGPTSLLNSVLKLDAATHYRGGYNLNLTLPAGVTEDGLRSLVETFFRAGGQELQVNCLDADLLRAAQRNPEQHGDLLVRVAGLSARFVDLSPVQQEELVVRAESLARSSNPHDRLSERAGRQAHPAPAEQAESSGKRQPGKECPLP